MSIPAGPDETTSRWLDPDEEVAARLDGAGAILLVTQRRVVLIREGSEFRPRSGIRWWPYDSIVEVSLSKPMGGQGRIMLQMGLGPTHLVSMFFASGHWSVAQDVVREIERRTTALWDEPGSGAPGPEA
jgi:hypothetical protein